MSGVTLRYPNITASSEKEQISQIKSYLHQLVDQLNYAIPTSGAVEQTVNVQGQEISYYDLRTLILQEVQEVQTIFDQLVKQFETHYVKNSGWTPGMHLATDEEGIVVTVDTSKEIDEAVAKALTEDIALQAANKIAFTLDEEGDLYYEVLGEEENPSDEVEDEEENLYDEVEETTNGES